MSYTIDYNATRKAAYLLRAFNNSFRQTLLNLLIERPGISVTEIYVAVKCEQSVASQHLSVLRKAGLVTPERTGKVIKYSVNRDRIAKIEHLSSQLNSLY